MLKFSAFIGVIFAANILNPSESNLRDLAHLCDINSLAACQQLAEIHDGQCASPGAIGGCKYDSRLSY